MTPLEKRSFLEALTKTGDRAVVCDDQHISLLELTYATESDLEFATGLRMAERCFADMLKRTIESVSLTQLAHVLKYGTVTVTSTNSNDDIFGYEYEYVEGVKTRMGNEMEKIGVKQSVKQIVKKERHVQWAIREGLRFVLIRQAQEEILNNIRGMINDGVFPENSESLVTGLMDDFQNQVKSILKGDRDDMEVTDNMIAQIQQRVING